MRFNQSDLGCNMLIMLIRAEECDVALVVAARKEDMPAVRKHCDESLSICVLFSFFATSRQMRPWGRRRVCALTHLEGLAQFGVGDLFQL